MRIVRFWYKNEINYGLLAGNQVEVVDGDIYGEYTVTNLKIALTDVKLTAPCLPSKAVCIGLNYLDHAREMKDKLPANPLLFLKPSSAVIGDGDDIEYPSLSENLHYEGELAVVIGKTARKVPLARALDYVWGYTCANDVTARDLQHQDGQWTRGKSFDTFMPIGPWLETEIDPGKLAIKSYLNGEIRQSSNTANLIFKVPELISFITEVMTLYPGDVILTGTPAGVGPMQIGDTITVEIEGIGTLTNKVV